jgi:hypothetical protein
MPTQDERLARIREVVDNGLRYYATAYLRTDEAAEHVVKDRTSLMGEMIQLANLAWLLDRDELDDRSMLGGRGEIVQRYLEGAGSDPWTPPSL